MIWGHKKICQSFTLDQKKNFKGTSKMFQPMENFMSNDKETILKKINVSFIVHFCLGKYGFSLDTFWIHFLLLCSMTYILLLIVCLISFYLLSLFFKTNFSCVILIHIVINPIFSFTNIYCAQEIITKKRTFSYCCRKWNW